ncbi:amino acid ABC transporter permease [Lysinibacillus sp. CD3-6]|jgi:polar amino acid transport system permease protein|uniref:amino acid ABC transporter permease n=1 Tax=unclassified Lysinibacillus TaxID=2636778 RepID=UPI0011759762|nr:amino acid ABC transporter permease [Lysinibacillus sp. CD3-6]UED82207.1 amino acid ABC transporter permease [Lysinibacillus sp. CD3-6]
MLEIFQSNYKMLFDALWVTLSVTVCSLVLGSIVGLIIAFFNMSKIKVLKYFAAVYLAIIRGTPMIVQIFILYFGISSFLTLPSFWAGVLALAVHNGAYISEIFRGAIQSIDRGQMEAARSLGMSQTLGMRRVILPQAMRRAIPPLGNQFIILLKESALVAYIGMSDLWSTTLAIAGANYRPLETYMVTGAFYLILVLAFTFIFNRMEKRLNLQTRH